MRHSQSALEHRWVTHILATLPRALPSRRRQALGNSNNSNHHQQPCNSHRVSHRWRRARHQCSNLLRERVRSSTAHHNNHNHNHRSPTRSTRLRMRHTLPRTHRRPRCLTINHIDPLLQFPCRPRPARSSSRTHTACRRRRASTTTRLEPTRPSRACSRPSIEPSLSKPMAPSPPPPHHLLRTRSRC